MRPVLVAIFALCFLVLSSSTAEAQYFLFKQKRRGGFKVKPHDELDFSNAQHFTGSGMVAVGFYRIFRNTNMKYPKLFAGLMASGVGLLKEVEDGYREGFGVKDVIFNELGITAFLLSSNLTHFTLAIKQVVTTSDDYGVGVRFFRTTEFLPLQASFGLYTIRNNHEETWVGIDSSIHLYKELQLSFGMSMIKLETSNFAEFRPNFGLAYQIF